MDAGFLPAPCHLALRLAAFLGSRSRAARSSKPSQVRASLGAPGAARPCAQTKPNLMLPPAFTPRKARSPPELARTATGPLLILTSPAACLTSRGAGELGSWHGFSRHRVCKSFPCSALTSPSLSPQSNFLGNSAVAFPSLSPNKYHAKQDEYLLPRPSGMTHFLNQGRCNWALESWTPPKAGRFCNNYSKKQKE